MDAIFFRCFDIFEVFNDISKRFMISKIFLISKNYFLIQGIPILDTQTQTNKNNIHVLIIMKKSNFCYLEEKKIIMILLYQK